MLVVIEMGETEFEKHLGDDSSSLLCLGKIFNVWSDWVW